MPYSENTLVTWIDNDGKKAAKSLVSRNKDVARLVTLQDLRGLSFHLGNLIIVGHGSTMVKMNRYAGLSEAIGTGTFTFIILAACEVGEVHQNIGEMQSIAQGLANLRRCTVWGTTRSLPQEGVAMGTAFYKSPVFQWLQAANDTYAGMWKEFSPQSHEEQALAMMGNLNMNSM